MAFFGLFGKKKSPQQIDSEIDSIVNGGQSNPQLNPQFKTFDYLAKDISEIIADRSLVTQGIDKATTNLGHYAIGYTNENIDAIPVLTNKWQRLQYWRNESAYPIVNWALEEIANDFIHVDEAENFITLKLPDGRDNITAIRKEILQNEFSKFIELFDFDNNGFKLFKRFLVDGELLWENIINPSKPDLGIQGLKFIRPEYYESLVDPKTGDRVGVFIDLKKIKQDIATIISTSYYNSYKIFNSLYSSVIGTYSDNTCVPFLWPQVTYVDSSERTPDDLIPLSLMEKIKQPYQQLALMEDAAIIMRVTRAPERYLFNINTGNMSDKVADQYLHRFQREFNSRKIVTGPNVNGLNGGAPKDATPQITSIYNPVSMLTAWIFGKSNANDGSTVESVGSTANFEQLDDIEYFLRRLLKVMNVPFSRYKTPENTIERNDTITYEEYAFATMIINQQKLFAKGIKESFIVHLKLRGLWDKYSLKKNDLKVKFIVPILWELYEKQKLLEAKMAAYATVGDREEFSKITAMKKILGMTDEEIEENYSNLIKEAMLMQKIEWAKAQLDERGPKDKTLPIPLEGDKDAEEEGGENPEESPENEEEGGEEAPSEEPPEEEEGGEEGAEELAVGGSEEPSEEPNEEPAS